MPYATVGNTRIHYELEGNGPPLVLVHGFTSSLESWYDAGYVEPLSRSYRLILVDVRGHGASDKPHDPDAYASAIVAADIAGVLDDVGVDRTHFFGYSMGARLGYTAAKYARDRLASVALGGWAPGASTPEIQAAFMDVLDRGADAWVDMWGQQGTPLTDEMQERLRTADFTAYAAWWRKRMQEGDVLGDALSGFERPHLIFAGDKDIFYDKIVEYCRGLETGSLVTLEGLNHLDGFLRTDLTLPLLSDFLSAAVRG